MSAPTTDPAAPPTPAPVPAPPTPPVPTPPVPAEPAAPAPQGWDGKIESLDPAAQKIIADLRKEAGESRVAKTAAEQKAQSILDAIATATGTKPESDPAKLAADLTAAQQVAQTAARELAVYKAAGNLADPVKLLDRTSFTNAIKGIDPADGVALTAAIDAAVKADPTLKAARAAGASGIEQTGGSGEQGQITEEQLQKMTPEQIDEAYKKGLLNSLL